MKITEVEILDSDYYRHLEEKINDCIKDRAEQGWTFKDLKSSKKQDENIIILIFEKDVDFYKTRAVLI